MRFALLLLVVPVLMAAKADTSTKYACEAKQSALKKKEAKGECVEFAKGALALTCDAAEDAAKVMAFGKQCRDEDEAKLAAAQAKYDESKKKAADSKAEREAKSAGTGTGTTGGTSTSAAPPAGALEKNKCQAELEDGTVIASGEGEKYTDCSKQVEAAVKIAKCIDGAKKFKYLFRRGDQKPSSRTVYCK